MIVVVVPEKYMLHPDITSFLYNVIKLEKKEEKIASVNKKVRYIYFKVINHIMPSFCTLFH